MWMLATRLLGDLADTLPARSPEIWPAQRAGHTEDEGEARGEVEGEARGEVDSEAQEEAGCEAEEEAPTQGLR